MKQDGNQKGATNDFFLFGTLRADLTEPSDERNNPPIQTRNNVNAYDDQEYNDTQERAQNQP